jgi:hypothetical protein
MAPAPGPRKQVLGAASEPQVPISHMAPSAQWWVVRGASWAEVPGMLDLVYKQQKTSTACNGGRLTTAWTLDPPPQHRTPHTPHPTSHIPHGTWHRPAPHPPRPSPVTMSLVLDQLRNPRGLFLFDPPPFTCLLQLAASS